MAGLDYKIPTHINKYSIVRSFNTSGLFLIENPVLNNFLHYFSDVVTVIIDKTNTSSYCTKHYIVVAGIIQNQAQVATYPHFTRQLSIIMLTKTTVAIVSSTKDFSFTFKYTYIFNYLVHAKIIFHSAWHDLLK